MKRVGAVPGGRATWCQPSRDHHFAERTAPSRTRRRRGRADVGVAAGSPGLPRARQQVYYRTNSAGQGVLRPSPTPKRWRSSLGSSGSDEFAAACRRKIPNEPRPPANSSTSSNGQRTKGERMIVRMVASGLWGKFANHPTGYRRTIGWGESRKEWRGLCAEWSASRLIWHVEGRTMPFPFGATLKGILTSPERGDGSPSLPRSGLVVSMPASRPFS